MSQQDFATIQHNTRRASYGTSAPTARRGSVTAGSAAAGPSGSPTSPGAGSGGSAPTVAVGPRNEATYGLDTWSSFLYQSWSVQQARARCVSTNEADREEAATKAANLACTTSPPPPGTLRRVDMLGVLQNIIAQQNTELVTMRQETLSMRRTEAKAHAPSPPRSSVEEEGQGGAMTAPEEDSTSAGAAAAAVAPAGPSRATDKVSLENTMTVSVLARLLEPCREQWQATLSARFSASAAATALPSSTKNASATTGKVTGSSKAERHVPALPTPQNLLECVVSGLRSDATTRYITADLLGVEASELTAGIDLQGLFTSFEPPVVALTGMYTSVVPSLKQLREHYFAGLDPCKLTITFTQSFLDTSLEVMEEQLDTILRHGSSVEHISALLLEGVHPSLRRLVYARALQLSLAVTDGQPLFEPNGTDLFVNSPGPSLAAFLSCGTKYARDKVRRRFHHYYSSPVQQALVRRLQASMAADNASTIGNDERYFVFEEEVATLGGALVADKSVPDVKLKTALLQLGHSEDTFEAYITFLAQQDGDWIVQKAPPCGFVPLAGSSLLMAPLAYVTGDTAEQYELASSMFAQLWSRLQGPTPEFLQCCCLFEQLVATLAPEATLHASRVLQFPALRLAVEWMTTGFVTLLEPAELLLLWDVVLAYHAQELVRRSTLTKVVGLADAEGISNDTNPSAKSVSRADAAPAAACALWVLPLFAAGLFIWRAPLIQACRTPEELHELFVSGHNIRARAVLQQILFLMDD